MSKYIDAEKLKAEIDRLKSTLADPLCSQGNILGPDWVAGGNKMLKEISSIIDTLQQEQPVEKLKNDDIGKYVREHFYYNKELYGYSHSKDLSVFTTDDIINLAHHFYELGLNARKGGIEYGME